MSSCAGAGMHRCMRGVAWGGEDYKYYEVRTPPKMDAGPKSQLCIMNSFGSRLDPDPNDSKQGSELIPFPYTLL